MTTTEQLASPGLHEQTSSIEQSLQDIQYAGEIATQRLVAPMPGRSYMSRREYYALKENLAEDLPIGSSPASIPIYLKGTPNGMFGKKIRAAMQADARILVAEEDQEGWNQVITTELQALGHQVVQAYSVSEALEQLKTAEHFDGVTTSSFADRSKRSGTEGWEQIRDIAQQQHTETVVISTGSAGIRDRLGKDTTFILKDTFKTESLKDLF